MSKQISIDLKDKYRVLLTEVLPYELPIWFDASVFYELCKTKDFVRNHKSINKISSLKKNYIPLEYKISRGNTSSSRSLSIMHPLMQIETCEFYEKHHNLIKYYASRSPHSLRHPYRLARKFFDKNESDSKAHIRLDVDGHESKIASSYFKYKSIAFLYNFFEGYEYHRLEKRFSHMLQVDIAKCFPSIYTHSIGWATKSKRITKQNLKNNKGSFDDDFDSLMQNTNYRETNGIIIGPEVSRIFAEIILQKIDLNTVETMKQNDFYVNEHFQFKRYVDDYFIFFNNEDVKTCFIKSLENSLLEYKLYLNESKTEVVKRPFVTKISLAKHSIKKQLGDFYKSRYSEADTANKTQDVETNKQQTTNTHYKIRTCSNPGRTANQAIAKLKYSFFDYAIDYQSVSNFLMSIIEKNLLRFFKIAKEIHSSEGKPTESFEFNITNWVLVDLDILFFVHAMDLRIRPTDRLARCLLKILDNISFLPETMKSLIQQKIFDGLRLAIDIVVNNQDIDGLETLNLITIMGELPDSYTVHVSKLETYYEKISKNSLSDNSYFVFITLIFYMKSNNKLSEIRKKVIDDTVLFIKNHPDKSSSTEFFILFFDFLACPYIEKNLRIQVYEEVTKQRANGNPNTNIYFEKGLFVDWSNPNFLRKNLEKKSFIFAYA